LRGRTFYARARELTADLDVQGHGYLRDHAVRFAATYDACRPLLDSSSTLVSIGSGSAYVESLLRADVGCRVVVADFPEAIDTLAPHYRQQGFETVAADLSAPDLDLGIEPAELLLSGEIVEHLPEPPANHFVKFGRYVIPGGRIVVTTPNYGSLNHLLRILFMRPTLPEAKLTFGLVCFENEGVHRREYMPVEIHDALREMGFTPDRTSFTWYHWPLKNSERLLYPPQFLVPRLRPCMVITGKKGAPAPPAAS
jgi:hypothetical protein